LFNKDHSFFSTVDGLGQQQLRMVLQAYAMYNPTLGYCQGMGMIVGLLLMRMSPQQTFSILIQLLQHFIPEYHSETLYRLRVDALVFDVLLQKYTRLGKTMVCSCFH
jgi:hypothetical protein